MPSHRALNFWGELHVVCQITKFYCYLFQSVKEDYQEKQAQSGHTQPIEFQSDKITLDIPMTGVSSEGWKINPLFPPVVSFT